MSESRPRNFRFPVELLEAWQLQADRETKGNLTQLIISRMKSVEIESKLDEIIEILQERVKTIDNNQLVDKVYFPKAYKGTFNE